MNKQAKINRKANDVQLNAKRHNALVAKINHALSDSTEYTHFAMLFSENIVGDTVVFRVERGERYVQYESDTVINYDLRTKLISRALHLLS